MANIGHLIYNSFLTFLFFCTLPFFALKGFLSHGTVQRERWGLYSQEFLQRTHRRPSLWFHAASVGEVGVALILVKEMREIYPGYRCVVSTTTLQGREIASHAPGVDAALLAPFDLPWIVRRALLIIRPRILLVAETELWPNLLREVKRQGIPIVLFNGRISSRSYRFYRPLRFFFHRVVSTFDLLCLKTDADRERMVRLGADPQAAHVTGDLKFHRPSSKVGYTRERLRQELRLHGGHPVFIAGSTHEGEEEMILGVFKELRSDFPRLILILAPRHLQRVPRVEAVLKSQGVHWVRKTKIDDDHKPQEVILLDTIGELADVYGLGTAVFVGGSFCKVGGHNVLEVLAHGTGVVFGPHMENFSDVARLLVEQGAGVQVSTSADLTEILKKILGDPLYRQVMGRKGLMLLQGGQGALERTIQLVRGLLQE